MKFEKFEMKFHQCWKKSFWSPHEKIPYCTSPPGKNPSHIHTYLVTVVGVINA